MKTMIEVDIPAGRSVAEAINAVKMAFSPDWMAEWWNIDDVIEQAENHGQNIDEDDARWVLQMMDKYHDCNYGHTWDSMDCWIEKVINKEDV